MVCENIDNYGWPLSTPCIHALTCQRGTSSVTALTHQISGGHSAGTINGIAR